MRIVGTASDAEVVAAFLRGELDSPRFSANVRQALVAFDHSESILRRPDLNSAAENGARERILSSYRGWRRNAELFSRFPSDTVWNRAVLTRIELAEIRCLNFPEWVGRSGGTRLPELAAERLRTGAAADPQVRSACAAVAQHFNTGGGIEPIVLVDAGPNSRIVALVSIAIRKPWVSLLTQPEQAF